MHYTNIRGWKVGIIHRSTEDTIFGFYSIIPKYYSIALPIKIYEYYSLTVKEI